jgi:GNAT superfamily N-acetyltransferase
VPITFRRAQRADVPAIVAMLADDDLGAGRELVIDPLPAAYWDAFDAIDADGEHQLLVVGEDDGGRVVATLQLTFIPSLTYAGGERAQIEAVRVDSSARGGGIGGQLVAWAIDRARERGCRLVQLTTNVARPDAHRFYEAIGFERSHVGMKLQLGSPPVA